MMTLAPMRALCLLLLLWVRLCVAKEQETLPATLLSSEIASLASRGDAVQLWQVATNSAAAAVVEALRKQVSHAQHCLRRNSRAKTSLRIRALRVASPGFGRSAGQCWAARVCRRAVPKQDCGAAGHRPG
jgi:hypothetical protein